MKDKNINQSNTNGSFTQVTHKLHNKLVSKHGSILKSHVSCKFIKAIYIIIITFQNILVLKRLEWKRETSSQQILPGSRKEHNKKVQEPDDIERYITRLKEIQF